MFFSASTFSWFSCPTDSVFTCDSKRWRDVNKSRTSSLPAFVASVNSNCWYFSLESDVTMTQDLESASCVLSVVNMYRKRAPSAAPQYGMPITAKWPPEFLGYAKWPSQKPRQSLIRPLEGMGSWQSTLLQMPKRMFFFFQKENLEKLNWIIWMI